MTIEHIEGNGSTIVTQYDSRISFGTYQRNGHAAHDRVVLRYDGMKVDLDVTMLATILDGVVPGLSVTYTAPRIPDATLAAIQAARGLLSEDGDPVYRLGVVSLIAHIEAWPGVDADRKVDVIESLLRN